MNINVGIIGFAHGHVNAYCKAWKADERLGVLVRAGWDHDAQRLQNAAGKHDFEPCPSMEALLARDDIEAVVIASETSLHADYVEKAAQAGKTIILQKPMALTMDEADRIVRAVQDNKVRFTIAWQMRVDPQNIRIKELLEEDALGNVFMLRRRHGLPVCLNEKFASSWHVSKEHNRDIWADDASHPVDFIYWLLGMPESVNAEILSLHDERMPMDNGVALFRYPKGPLAEVSCSFTNLAAENTTEVIGEKGSIIQNFGDAPSCNVPRAEDAVGLKWFLKEQETWTESAIPSPQNHGERIEALAIPLAQFLRGEREAIASVGEGRDALRMVLACHLSAAEGRRISLQDEGIYSV